MPGRKPKKQYILFDKSGNLKTKTYKENVERLLKEG